jgi:hypothetical protein
MIVATEAATVAAASSSRVLGHMKAALECAHQMLRIRGARKQHLSREPSPRKVRAM